MASSSASNPISTSTSTGASGASEKSKPSNDPGWDYAEIRDPSDKNKITCKLCGRTLNSGIFRLKEHLVGGRRNAVICSKVTPDIQKRIKNYMVEQTRKRDEKKRINALLGGQDTLLTQEELEEERLAYESMGSGVDKRPKTTDTRGPMERHFLPDLGKQTTIDEHNPTKKHLKEIAWKNFAKWGYEVRLPFNAVRTPSFQTMIHSIGNYGKGMPAPSYHNYRVTLMKNVMDETKEFVNSMRPHWEHYGCSIMSDWWTDGKGRSLINFLVNCPVGTVFLKSLDGSEYVKDAALIVDMINEVIKDVGAHNIVQLITDNGSNYVAAGKILMQQHPTLYWTPCAAHCLNLMLHDVCMALPKIQKVLTEARALVVYIYNHGRVLHLMRKFTNNRELHRSAVTRFATSFYTLESIDKNKAALRGMFVSSQWGVSNFAKTPEGKKAEKTVLKGEFWDNVFFACSVMAPLVDVIRLVDREEKPCMGYIYEAIDRAKEQIKKNLEKERRTWMKLWEIIDKRWECQMHHPLHAAGIYLNPGIFYKNPKELELNNEVKTGLFGAIDRLVPDEDEGFKIIGQLMEYANAVGTLGGKFAVSAREKMQPCEWWSMFGSQVPELQKFAIRVLSQTCSASPCERNWSTFDNIHSKKRNCLLQQKLNDLVFIQYNERLRRRHEERKALPSGSNSDPIILREVDENNEWIIPTDQELQDFVHQGDDLLWRDVEAAIGNDDDGPRTRRNVRREEETDAQPSFSLGVDDDVVAEEQLSGDDEDVEV